MSAYVLLNVLIKKRPNVRLAQYFIFFSDSDYG